MRRHFLLLLCAMQFLTRVPGIRLRHFEDEWMARCVIYFPVVGQIVGVLCGAVFIGASAIWQGWLRGLLAVATAVLLTGALHEDGLADVADGFAGGRDRAQRLAIMKDSRIGAFGALALIFSSLAKIGALSSLEPARGAAALIFAHGAARAAAVTVMAVLPYATDMAQAKTAINAHRLRRGELLIVLAVAVWPVILLPLSAAIAAVVGGTVLALAMAMIARVLIGGQTGDVLGAVEQMCEVGILLALAATMGAAT